MATHSPITALSLALTQRLASDTELLKVIPIDLNTEEEKNARLYDYIPKEAVSPYINLTGPIITDVKVTPENVIDLRITIHIWNNSQETGSYGNRLVSECLQLVKKALKYKLYPIGYEVINVRKNEEQIFDDVNAYVKHGVFSLTYTLVEKKEVI